MNNQTGRVNKRRSLRITALFLLIILLAALGAGIQPWWSMDDGSGQTVTDITGDLDAVRGVDSSSESSDPTWSTNCPSGSCLEFDGTDDRVTIPADNGMNYGTDYTLQAWFNTHTLNGDRRIFQRASSRYGMYIEDNLLHAYVDTSDSGGSWEAATWNIPQTNTWYHTVMTYDGSEIRLYVNGNLVDTQAQSGQTNSGQSLDPAIGAHQLSYSFDQYWDGLIDEVRTYDRVLSQSEIEDNYNNPGDSPPDTEDNYTKSGWQNSPQSVQLTCSDTETSCDRVEWRIVDGNGDVIRSDANAPNPDTVRVGRDTNGVLTLEYYGVDTEGHVESTGQVTVRVDKVAPGTMITGPDESSTYTSDIDVTVSEATAGGSPTSCYYRVQDGSSGWTGWQSRSCMSGFTVTVDDSTAECTTEGQNTCDVQTRMVDEAGNSDRSNIHEFTIDIVDDTPPTTSEDYTDDSWKRSAQEITISCNDQNPGCDHIDAEIRYPSNGSVVRSGTEYNNSVTLWVGSQANGRLELRYRGVDEDGNTESWNTQTVRVDKINPENQITGPSTDQWRTDDFHISVSESDAGGSGLDTCQYRTNNGGNGWTGWQNRSCSSDTRISVGSTGWCTTQGIDTCNVETRALDKAGNWDTSSAVFDIDYTSPTTTDDIEDSSWSNSTNNITITCTDTYSGCSLIEVQLYENGSLQRQESSSNNSLTVDIQSSGEIEVRYRGIDTAGNAERWNIQMIRVDNIGPITEIVAPDEDTWFNDDFEVTIRDYERGGSQLGALDLYYVVDNSQSFYDEWDTLEANIDYIEEELERNTSMDILPRVLGLNNTYDGMAAYNRVCMDGQTLSDPLYCERYSSIIEGITNAEPYTDWFGMDISNYNPREQPTVESPLEGWGMGILDVINRDNWRQNTQKVIVVFGDHDTNGGHHDAGHPSCGDDVSQQLADYLNTTVENENVHIFGMLGDPECSDDPNDGQHSSYSERQMNRTGDVIRYSEASELPEKIITAVQEFNATGCHFRVKDGSEDWTTWWPRTCPNSTLTIRVNKSNRALFECHQEGEDSCQVQSRVRDTAGNVDYATARFNIDLSPPNLSCDNCDQPDPVIVGNNITFLPNITDQYSGFHQAEVCAGTDCQNPYCSYTDPDSSCKHTATFPYGIRKYCITANDQVGNDITSCTRNNIAYTFMVKGGIGDPCNQDQECAIGSCEPDVCRGAQLPPPGIILH